MAAPTPKSAAETAVKRLYEMLTDAQKKEVCFDWDYKDPRRGLLLTFEQWASEETPGGRKTFGYRDWSVEKIKRTGADGVKLMLWWRPDAADDVKAHQRELVEQVGRECRRHDIAFLLEPLLYPLGSEGGGARYEEDAGKRPEMVI